MRLRWVILVRGFHWWGRRFPATEHRRPKRVGDEGHVAALGPALPPQLLGLRVRHSRSFAVNPKWRAVERKCENSAEQRPGLEATAGGQHGGAEVKAFGHRLTWEAPRTAKKTNKKERHKHVTPCNAQKLTEKGTKYSNGTYGYLCSLFLWAFGFPCKPKWFQLNVKWLYMYGFPYCNKCCLIFSLIIHNVRAMSLTNLEV